MTLAQLQADLYARLNYEAAPSSANVARLLRFLNETQEEIISRPGVSKIIKGQPLTFDSVASQAVYGLPPAVSRVLGIRDTANETRLAEMTEDYYRTLLPDPSTHLGTPVGYCQLGLQPVKIPPSNASELFLDSTSAADTQVAHFEVVLSDGSVFTGQVTMTGTTAVSLNTAFTNIVQVKDLYLASAANGTVTLHEDASGGTELARILVGNTRSLYQQIALIPTPSGVLTYTVDWEGDLIGLANATDQPVLPPRFHRLLVLGAVVKEWGQHQDDADRYQIALNTWDREIGYLNDFLVNSPDQVYVPGRKAAAAPNVLGPWFPANWYGH